LFDGVAATSFNIFENTAGVDITELSALDPDEGQTHTFTLTKQNILNQKNNVTCNNYNNINCSIQNDNQILTLFFLFFIVIFFLRELRFCLNSKIF
jgi:hypothetical protein